MSALQKKTYIYDCIGLLLFVFIYKVRAIPFYDIHIVLQNQQRVFYKRGYTFGIFRAFTY